MMKKRTLLLGIVVGVILFGALAALLGLLLPFVGTVAAQSPGEGAGSERVMLVAVEENINGESFGGEVRLTFKDAAELPEGAADASGLFLELGGNTLTLGTGPIEVEVGVEVVNDEEPVTTVNASHRGDEVAVTVNDNTIFYRDTTARPDITPEDIEAGEMVISGTVEAGSLDEIGENMLIRVWGSEQDGVFVADVLVYEPIR